MTTPSSLRDLYSPPPPTWSFIPAQQGPVTSNATASSSEPPVYQYQWSRPPPNSIFDLSPSLNDPSGINVTLLLKAIVASAFVKYTTFAIAMPWDVGKTLLQVQWVPRDVGLLEPQAERIEEVEEEVLSNSSSDEQDSYFADPTNPAPPASRYSAPRESGYVVRRSVVEEATRPEYIIPVGSAGGVWGMMRRVARFKGEGWLALWKGTLTSCVMDFLSSTIQPVILGVLQAMFLPNLSPYQQPPLILPVASHVITGFLVSPLDLVRTRLMVQSSMARHRSYSGPIDAMSQIIRDEGGLRGIYLHPHLLIPTLVDSTLRALIPLALPGIIASNISPSLSEETHPIAWSFLELAGDCAGLLVTLPFETVRRRLQVQTRGSAKPLKACVELRPAPYNGVIDTLWHVLTEERSDLPLEGRRTRRKEKGKDREEPEAEDEVIEEGWFKNTGIGQLYRGLGMRLSASAVMFVLGMLSGEERDAGWTEL
ncbi:mitochondrial carrier [Gloeophyllum trabeum ATCC 11539]|uniref:Mitochondrial carrier n=1 Tax=Gloeophyllum trabeum (strain ATCC 11539 / FP-39264 / Madison 617) TaxID=670483 RepID=S7S544_GLOTA|nr:mitochondrial carrier [Gloeophyllum trabeum ATCC 11539]EPQ61054.1 mitochondrial carrier [Gloeophyllum trabeum ATCC 11539]